MTTPITLADLRNAPGAFGWSRKCAQYVEQLLAAPERVKVSERWCVRGATDTTYATCEGIASARRWKKEALANGWTDLTIVHVTVFRTVKK